MVRIKTDLAYKYGQTNVLPFLGDTVIDENGFIEVENTELAQQVIDAEIGFYLPSEVETTTTTTTKMPVTTTTTTEAPVTTTTTTIAVVEEVVTTTTTEAPEIISSSEKEELLNSIDNLLLPALQSMAAPFPKAEWSSLTKPKLQEYLKKQLADA